VFPFERAAIPILGIWFIGLLVWEFRTKEILARWMIRLATRTALYLGCVYLGDFVTGSFLFLMVSYIRNLVLYFSARRKLVTPRQRSAFLSMWIGAAVVLVPFVVSSYWRSANMDTLERLVAYVHSGTGPSLAITARIAKDPDFTLQRLIPLLVSDKRNDRSLAFEILRQRKNPNDLSVLRATILSLPDDEFDEFFLQEWFGNLGAPNELTKEEFRTWTPPPITPPREGEN
jgi:hypothetical protein